MPAVFDGYGVAIVPDRPCYADEIATPRKYGVGMTGVGTCGRLKQLTAHAYRASIIYDPSILFRRMDSEPPPVGGYAFKDSHARDSCLH